MRIENIIKALDAVEKEMKRLGLYEDADSSFPKVTSAFGYGQISFEQWLSQSFLPKAHAAIQSGELPNDSQVGVAAMRNFGGDERMDELVSLLGLFDQSIKAYARRQGTSDNSGQHPTSKKGSFFRQLFQRASRDA